MAKEIWRFIQSGRCSPSYNMALDEAILNWQSQGLFPPTVRFYEWDVPTLTVGYFQRVEKEIDVTKVKVGDYGFVRRQTGGRGVLHANELTYSVIVPESHQEMPETVIEAYRVISRGVLEGFRELGLQANFSIPDSKEQEDILRNPRSAVCFDTPSWYEIVVEGRKIAGSAQTRKKGIILQHGSIPLSINVDELYDLFKFASRETKEQMKALFTTKAASINELSPRDFTMEEVKRGFYLGFQKGLQIDLELYALTEEQEREVRVLAVGKYESDKWNYKY